MLKSLRNTKTIKFLISYNLTVVCLLVLIILTFWGTLYQVEEGLYATKQRFFNSWFFLTGGFLPFPGARLILWISFINLLCVILFRFTYRWSRAGMLLIHLGIMLLLVGSGATFHFSQDSNLTLKEGEGTNVSVDYHKWELALWTQTVRGDTTLRKVEAKDINHLIKGGRLSFASLNLEATVTEYYPNCKALKAKDTPPAEQTINASGILRLEPQKPSPDPAWNSPGLIISLSGKNEPDDNPRKILLYAGDIYPTPLSLNKKLTYCSLRRRTLTLPIILRLIDFQKTEHPGTSMARGFQSRVVMSTGKLEREVVISMNKPLRHKDYTFYQSSYSQSEQGETSTLAVVRNPGRLIPYIASLVIGLGLIIHFCIMLWKYALRKQNPKVINH
jgi:hypothetical protein